MEFNGNKDNRQRVIEFLTMPLRPPRRELGSEILARVRRNILTGMLVVMPLVIGFLPVLFIYPKMLELAYRIPSLQKKPEWLAFFLALLLVLAFLYMVGVFSATFIMRFVVRMSEKVLNQIPVVNWCYRMTKQVADLVSAGTSKPFQRVVMVEYPRRGVHSLGFVTGESIHQQGQRKLVHIFIPATPIPTTGFLILMEPEEIQEVAISVESAIRFIISGGILHTGEMKLKPYQFSASEDDEIPVEPVKISAGSGECHE